MNKTPLTRFLGHSSPPAAPRTCLAPGVDGLKAWGFENEPSPGVPSRLPGPLVPTRKRDVACLVLRTLWRAFLKFIFFRFYCPLKVVGSYEDAIRRHPRALVIANHASHLDAIAISTSIPHRMSQDLYFIAAKDHFFASRFMSFFSRYCIGAIPIDRRDRRGGAAKICLDFLTRLPRIWMVVFPEGTRSTDGLVHPFKKGIGVFAEKSDTPILFLYLDGPFRLWPKKQIFAVPGPVTVHVGPVHPPAPVDVISKAYREWVMSINPQAFAPEAPQAGASESGDAVPATPVGGNDL